MTRVTTNPASDRRRVDGGGHQHSSDALDARNFFDPPEQPEFKMKQFGASLGGPIKHDRVFFYANYEGSRKKLGSVQTGTVPSAAFRTTVPAELQSLLSTVPLPVSDTANPNVGLARVSGTTDVNENIWSVRVDVRPNDNDNFFARANVQDSVVDGPLFVLQARQFAGQRQVRADRVGDVHRFLGPDARVELHERSQAGPQSRPSGSQPDRSERRLESSSTPIAATHA